MPDDRDRKDLDTDLDPEDVNSAPASAGSDPADDLPVPIMMTPAEIDERAKVVETLRKRPDARTDADPDDDRRFDA